MLSDEEKAARKAAREAEQKAKRDAWIKKTVDEAPPLTPAQIETVARLLRPPAPLPPPAQPAPEPKPTAKDIKRAAAAVAAAWNDAGPVPSYHYAHRDRLRTEWPVLAAAVEKLAELHREGARK